MRGGWPGQRAANHLLIALFLVGINAPKPSSTERILKGFGDLKGTWPDTVPVRTTQAAHRWKAPLKLGRNLDSGGCRQQHRAAQSHD